MRCCTPAGVLAVLLACTAPTVQAQAPVSDPARLETRVTQLERSVASGSSLTQIHQVLQRLEREVRELRGEIELQAHETKQLQQRQRQLYLDLDKRLQAIEKGAPETPPGTPPASSAAAGAPPAAANAPAAPPASVKAPADANAPASARAPAPTPPAPAAAAVDPAAEQQSYRAAFDLLKSGKFSEASTALNTFLKEYPNGRFADNAQYWLGESHYVSREFDPALASFEKLLDDYPDSPKRSHAMLKIGFIYDEKGRKDEARKVLTELVKTYPQSTAAGLAEKRLKRLE
jgi:tol-pal system protein YbgF